MNELTDDIGIAANGRIGLDEGTDGLSVGMGFDFLFPTSDGPCRNTKTVSGFLPRPASTPLELENKEPLFRCILWPFFVGNLVPSFSQDIGGLTEDFLEGLANVSFSGKLFHGLCGVPELGEVDPFGETHQFDGFQDGPESDAWQMSRLAEFDDDAVCVGLRRRFHSNLQIL